MEIIEQNGLTYVGKMLLFRLVAVTHSASKLNDIMCASRIYLGILKCLAVYEKNFD